MFEASPEDPASCLVAVVDDEAALRETLSMALAREGYRVAAYANGIEAWEAFSHRVPDVVLLDVTMPGMDGLELCRRLRAVHEALPIVFLSSRDEEVDRILGLELGGDDYLTKPFSLRELMVRIKAVRRRVGRMSPPSGSAGPLNLDEEAFLVHWRGAPVPLTVTEFRIAACLFRHPGHVRTRDQLIEAAYPGTFVEARTMDTHIKRIRRKFESVDPEFAAITAVPGLGYRGQLP